MLRLPVDLCCRSSLLLLSLGFSLRIIRQDIEIISAQNDQDINLLLHRLATLTPVSWLFGTIRHSGADE